MKVSTAALMSVLLLSLVGRARRTDDEIDQLSARKSPPEEHTDESGNHGAVPHVPAIVHRGGHPGVRECSDEDD
jgi:hypothetical protein